MAYLPPETVRARYQDMCARDRKIRPLLYGACTIVLVLFVLFRLHPTFLPELPCLLLMIAAGIVALVSGIRMYFLWFCPVCGMPLYARWNPLLGSLNPRPLWRGFGVPTRCNCCHTDFVTGESRRKT